MDRRKLGSGVGIGAALALTGALVFGGYSVFHGVGQSATADVPAYSGPVAASVAAPAQDDAAAQSIYDQQIAQAKADAEAAAAAQVAAQQAAAEAAAQAAKKAATKAAGPIRCPAGSQANSGDGGNDTSCFPEICFHLVLPDPAHPECVTAFKP